MAGIGADNESIFPLATKNLHSTEIWSQPKTQCDLPDFPLKVEGAVGFWTAQGPVVCGGQQGRDGNWNMESRCFLYKQKHHQWMPWTNMTRKREFASAVQINSHQTFIIGGSTNGYGLKSTELLSSTGSEDGKDFPKTIEGHCTFKINSTHALVTGGIQGGVVWSSTWFVDLTTSTFTPGPTMKMRIRNHGCGTFKLGSKTYGIVAGGWFGNEIIDLNHNSPTWTEGM